MRAIRAGIALAVLVLAFVAAGCGSHSGDTTAPDPATPHVLRRGLGAEPGTLDPHLAADNAALAVVADLHEGLTTEASDGSIAPGHAESWIVADDGRVYTFRLRHGLRWSNGDALTAEHFAAGLRHALATATASPNAGLLDAVEHVVAVDAETLRIRLRRPVPYLPAVLALPVASPMHPQAASLAARPGNGPYRLVRRLPGERIELERNPHYWDAANVSIASVTHVTVSDLTTEVSLYRTGELDLTSEVANTQLHELQERLPGELQLVPYLSVYAYAVNLARLPDPRARLALAMAIDRSRITQQVTGAGELPAYGWVPDGIAGYTPARFAWRDMPHSQAVEQARQLWEAARRAHAAPSRLKLCTDASANHHRTAIAIADLWRSALGVETEIVELEWTVYLDTRRHPGECDLVRFGWSADFVDPEAFAMVFESDHPQNTLGYANAAYDEWLARSRAGTDIGRRMAELAGAEALLLQDAPVIPVFFRVSKRLAKPYLQGAIPNPLGHVASRNLRFTQP
ncbi:MAG: peptide ABC transporter substrate-binding protein [Steroidobacteraceae bacterium]|nr:peptide ABC transporter substrate-binding protein [Steroidobacteraceae bacterium]